MAMADGEQKIARLTPLTEVLALIDTLAQAVRPCDLDVGDAVGRVLAADVTAPKRSVRAMALQDGWAVRADDLADAGGYAPVQLANPPVRVEAGDAMPDGADAVAPLEAVVLRGGIAEAVEAVAAGEGIAPAGADNASAEPLRKGGERMRAVDAAVLAAAEIERASVRAPRLRIAAAREDLRLTPALQFIAWDCRARGGIPMIHNAMTLDDVLGADDCDAVLVVGGSGRGRRDRSVRALARNGSVAVHGVGLTPGETAALGQVGSRPVLIVPGRLDAALAAWLTLGRALLARLSGDDGSECAAKLTLSRKVTSTVGLAEFVLVRRDGPNAEPFAGRYLPLSALARADGWLLVPAGSEGYPASAEVAVNTWP